MIRQWLTVLGYPVLMTLVVGYNESRMHKVRVKTDGYVIKPVNFNIMYIIH